MAASIPEKRRFILIDKTYFDLRKNAGGYHPGPVTPSTTDGAPFKELFRPPQIPFRTKKVVNKPLLADNFKATPNK